MINLKTPTKEVIETLTAEEGKAIFWLKKFYHGEKGYEKMCSELTERAYRTMRQQISEVVEYISPSGNRWMAFECATFYEGANHAYSRPFVFCYYETYGSVGAYILCRNSYDMEGDERCVLMFTDHFFLRFCQRLGVEMRSRWMIKRFVEVIPGFTLSFGEKNEQGLIKVDCRLPGSLGRGILRKDGAMIEIRTFLTDKELNGKQIRETKKIREVGDRQTNEPMVIRMARLLKSDDFSGELTKEMLNISDMTGIPHGDVIGYTNTMMFIIQAFVDLGYAKSEDYDFWQRFGKMFPTDDLMAFIKDYEKKEDGTERAKQLYDIIVAIGEKMDIKKYSPEQVMEKTIQIWREHVEEYYKNNNV